MGFSFGNRSKSRMVGIDSRLLEIATRAIEITKIDFGIADHGGLRTAEEQHKLFLDGLSNADGYVKKSYHQSGLALDFYAIDPETKKASWDPLLLSQVACAFLQAAGEKGCYLKWGGLFRSINDMPHVELRER